jgi:molybdopterin/thiamine biosynthesis adenylyltransferase
MNLDLAYSRPRGTVEQLGADAEDRHRFLDKHVVLTGEAEILATKNGRNCFLDSLRLLVRMCPNLTVAIPAGCMSLMKEARALSDHIAFGKKPEFRFDIESVATADAVLSIGSKVYPELPWTTINSNGWLIRVSSGDQELSAECEVSNPIGALAAACLGAGEVFKRLIRLRAERAELLNGFSYSLRTYKIGGAEPGPPLPDDLPKDLLVVGGGAIGNGLVHLISQLSFNGKIFVVDLQEYAVENLGTCILIGPGDLSRPKATVLAEVLKGAGTDAIGLHMPFGQYGKDSLQFPAIVVTGLDSIETRHEVQRTVWPDVLIDGAIGDFTCQVSRHPWADDVACLICLFRQPAGRRAEEVQSEQTGLARERLANLEAVITESDVHSAPADKREFLSSQLGRRICSVIQEAMAAEISREQQREGFQPSVPFVACFSACMVMSEAVAAICGWDSKVEPRFQFDFLRGPALGQELAQERRRDCICARRKNIEALRRARISRGSESGQRPRL